MIKNIVEILTKMQSDFTVKCFASLHISDTGNLILKWRLDHKERPFKISREIILSEDDKDNVDKIDFNIRQARRFCRQMYKDDTSINSCPGFKEENNDD